MGHAAEVVTVVRDELQISSAGFLAADDLVAIDVPELPRNEIEIDDFRRLLFANGRVQTPPLRRRTFAIYAERRLSLGVRDLGKALRRSRGRA